jgi:hypothetical protein
MTTATSTETTDLEGELLPGYYVDGATGAWLTLPWPGDHILPFNHPDRLASLPPSIGPQLIWWCEQWLIDCWNDRPWRFVPAQRRFLHLWFAVRDDDRWLYRSGVKRGAKGTGKDPLAAALALAELAGPTKPTGELARGGERAPWDSRYEYRPGEPIAVPQGLALVQIAANSEAQGADVLRVANAMVSRAMREEYAVDRGRTRTQIESGGRIELLTHSERSSEGDPATAIFLNESHHMTESSGGQASPASHAATSRRARADRPGCSSSRTLICPAKGRSPRTRSKRGSSRCPGTTRRADILYDSCEAPPHLRLHVEAELEEGIRAAYRDSPWTDEERIRDEAQDPRVPVADSVRYYFNALPTNETAWVSPASSMRWPDRSSSSTIVSRSRCSSTARSPRTRPRCPAAGSAMVTC